VEMLSFRGKSIHLNNLPRIFLVILMGLELDEILVRIELINNISLMPPWIQIVYEDLKKNLPHNWRDIIKIYLIHNTKIIDLLFQINPKEDTEIKPFYTIEGYYYSSLNRSFSNLMQFKLDCTKHYWIRKKKIKN
jgi:hypothetical protein